MQSKSQESPATFPALAVAFVVALVALSPALGSAHAGSTARLGSTSQSSPSVTAASSGVSSQPTSESSSARGTTASAPSSPYVLSLGPPERVAGSDPSPDYFDSSHYWAGAAYTGSATTATELKVTLQIPDDVPQGGNDAPGTSGGVWYVVLLSVFDNNNSYDQIGFGTMEGDWDWGFSTSIGCADFGFQSGVTTIYNPPVRGQTYVFEMSLSSGVLDFSAINANTSNVVWNTVVETSATSFTINGAVTSPCSTYDYTDYEEVMDTMGPFVPYDFVFTDNWANSFGSVGTWGVMSSGSPPPSGVNVWIGSGGSTTSDGCPADCPIMIANQPYYLSFTNGLDSMTVEQALSSRMFSWNVTVADFTSDSPIYLAFYSLPSGWTVYFTPTQGSPTFTAELVVSLLSMTPTGSYYIGVNATDGGGSGSYTHLGLSVDVLPILSIGISGNPGSGGIDVGQSTTFSASASGGSGDYTYDWTSIPNGCAAPAGTSFECVPPSSGNFSIGASVTDSLGYSATDTIVYAVESDPTIHDVTAAPTTLDVGQETSLNVSVSGGSGRYSFSWQALPGGCASIDRNPINCTPERSGFSEIKVNVTDSNGYSVLSTAVSVTVNPGPSVVSFTASPASVADDQATVLSVVASGGTGQLTYSYSNLPTGCVSTNTPRLTCVPTGTGTFDVTATVTDLAGESATASLSVTVMAGSSATPLGTYLGELTPWILLAALIVALAILAIVLSRRRHPQQDRAAAIAGSVVETEPSGGLQFGAGSTARSNGPSYLSGARGGGGSPSTVAPTEFEGTSNGNEGLDPGSAAFSAPLINPPTPTCWHCQYQNSPGSRYCARCAVPLEPPPPPSQ